MDRVSTGARCGGRVTTTMAALLFAVVLSAASVSLASAQTTRVFTGLSFGADGVGGAGTFQDLQGIAVDQSSGDVFAYDAGAGEIFKFDATGEPVEFSASGTNAIEGAGGAGPGENEIAVAPADSPGGTAGDIYVVHGPGPAQIYSSTGAPLGTLGQGTTSGEFCGVAVDPAGHIFLGIYFPAQVQEYVPTTNPPTGADLHATSSAPLSEVCNVGADGLGNVYAAQYSGSTVSRLQGIGDAAATAIAPGGPTLAVDPVTDRLFVDRGASVAQYDSAGALELTFGAGELANSRGVAVDSAADQIYVADNSTGTIKVFGPPVVLPGVAAGAATNVIGTKATLNGSVEPEGIAVEECFFEWGLTMSYGNVTACEGPISTDSDAHQIHAEVAGLTAGGTTYHYRLVAKNENGAERSADETLVTAQTAFTEAPTAVSATSATFHGMVRPEGGQYSVCKFEYGPADAAGFEAEATCVPPAASIAPDFAGHPVTAAVTGLQVGTEYKLRLITVEPAGTEEGETLTFDTVGPPRFTEVLARDADQGSATLEATIDPRGADTSLHFEWGSTDSYGNVTPAGVISAGDGPTTVAAHIDGLSPGTLYHYRLVADSTEGGEAVSPDQQLETLDSCGFTDGRCLELVSRPEKGPLASPGMSVLAGAEIQFQAASGGSALAYTVASGYPDATAGDAAVYLARRGSLGWSSAQLTPPTLAPPTGTQQVAVNGKINLLSSNLGCGVVASLAPLVPDAPTTVTEAGGANLYVRDNTTGSYRLITYLPPVGPPTSQEIATNGGFGAGEYQVVGISPNCRRVTFRTMYRYPGIPSVTARYQLYQWDDGALRNVALVPGPGGPAEAVPAESIPGAMDEQPNNGVLIGAKSPTDYWRSVSVTGSRTIFTSISRFGGDSGRRAVFSRDADLPDGSPALDISQSETGTPNDGDSRFWTASTDGQRIFFTARYGLARGAGSSGLATCANVPLGGMFEGSGEGCDLYEYDVGAPAGERLTDLSPDPTDVGGAGVVGVLDASEDGSYVYFAARGRIGDGGRTEAGNLEKGTYNIYVAHSGTVRFVDSLGQAEAIGVNGSALVNTGVIGQWTSRSTAGGTRLVFESSLDVPGGVPMVYLYSAGEGSTICLSCRRDGRPPFSEHGLAPLVTARDTNLENRVVQPTILTDNGRVYFYSFDPLAAGAVEGARNLYQWEHGQVSLIASEPLGVLRSAGNPTASFFGGASADGGDIYFATPQRLIGADRDEGWSVYDARAGGGFPERVAPAPPCDATVEGACNPGASGSPAQTAPATSAFSGPKNPPTKKHKKRKHHKKKKHGAKKHGKKKHQKPRRGNSNGGAAK